MNTEVEKKKRSSKPVVERLWAKVQVVNDKDSCWTFAGCQDASGYGRLNVKRKPEMAHRISWTLANGEVPEGLNVLHRCDNPPCVRPSHLFLGTHQENMADRDAKGRQARGAQMRQSSLTDEKVLKIRERYLIDNVTYIELAAEHDVTEHTIMDIVRGNTWTHLPNVCEQLFVDTDKLSKKIQNDEVVEMANLKLQGLTYAEIADLYEVNTSTVWRRLKSFNKAGK